MRLLRDELQEAHGPHARLLRLEAYLMARSQGAAPPDAMVMAALQTMALQPGAALIEPYVAPHHPTHMVVGEKISNTR